MSAQAREYSGAALHSFILALGHSQNIVSRILAEAGVDRIDPERWYDYDWALSIFAKIENEIGRAAIIEVGRKMIETAPYPPEIDSVQAVLGSLGQAFRMNARGPNIGDIVTTFDDEHSATIDCSVAGSCALNIGVIEGSCARFGVTPLIEHAGDVCKDSGANRCIYLVSW
jgi:hypothetical protein